MCPDLDARINSLLEIPDEKQEILPIWENTSSISSILVSYLGIRREPITRMLCFLPSGKTGAVM